MYCNQLIVATNLESGCILTRSGWLCYSQGWSRYSQLCPGAD